MATNQAPARDMLTRQMVEDTKAFEAGAQGQTFDLKTLRDWSRIFGFMGPAMAKALKRYRILTVPGLGRLTVTYKELPAKELVGIMKGRVLPARTKAIVRFKPATAFLRALSYERDEE